MVGSRSLTAIVGLVVGLLISAAAWVYYDTLLLFVLLPFVPFLFRSRGSGTEPNEEPPPNAKTCPVCDFATVNPEYSHCPKHGRRLEEPREAEREYA